MSDAASDRPESPDTLALDLERLEAIVHELEGDDLDLDRALTLFEEGVRYLRSARTRLAEADGRVRRVLEDAKGTLSASDVES